MGSVIEKREFDGWNILSQVNGGSWGLGRAWFKKENRMGGTFYPRSMAVAGGEKERKLGGTFYPRPMVVVGLLGRVWVTKERVGRAGHFIPNQWW